MRRRLAAAVLCALACAAAPPAAGAYVLDKGTGHFTNPPVGGVRASVPIGGSLSGVPQLRPIWAAAVRYWGGVPRDCRAGVRFRRSSEDPDADTTDTDTSAWVYADEACSIYFNEVNGEWPVTAETAYTWCVVVTHEMGHMLGLNHSRNPLNLMTGDWIPDATPECNRFTTDGSFYLPKIDDPYYDQQGRRRTAAEREAYLKKKRAKR